MLDLPHSSKTEKYFFFMNVINKLKDVVKGQGRKTQSQMKNKAKPSIKSNQTVWCLKGGGGTDSRSMSSLLSEASHYLSAQSTS